jgi:hypothetical protein
MRRETEKAWSLSLHASEFTSFSLYSTRSNQSFLAGIKVIKAKEGLVAVRLHLFLFALIGWPDYSTEQIGCQSGV